ncbi:MAG: hypothetical protein PHN37_00675 [Candidatus Pacebacteria bacterium]|nr:hypothetical protein [Candidatus Paceibacterota bacterium]
MGTWEQIEVGGGVSGIVPLIYRRFSAASSGPIGGVLPGMTITEYFPAGNIMVTFSCTITSNDLAIYVDGTERIKCVEDVCSKNTMPNVALVWSEYLDAGMHTIEVRGTSSSRQRSLVVMAGLGGEIEESSYNMYYYKKGSDYADYLYPRCNQSGTISMNCDQSNSSQDCSESSYIITSEDPDFCYDHYKLLGFINRSTRFDKSFIEVIGN